MNYEGVVLVLKDYTEDGHQPEVIDSVAVCPNCTIKHRRIAFEAVTEDDYVPHAHCEPDVCIEVDASDPAQADCPKRIDPEVRRRALGEDQS